MGSVEVLWGSCGVCAVMGSLEVLWGLWRFYGVCAVLGSLGCGVTSGVGVGTTWAAKFPYSNPHSHWEHSGTFQNPAGLGANPHPTPHSCWECSGTFWDVP